LDGEKRPCSVRTSNAGHCLFAGIASPERARRTAETLLNGDGFSGWGIRTVAGSEVRFNPISYHNGSIWPHDNALIAHGFARYGMKDEALRVMTCLFETSLFMELHRLPELFCGFHRRAGEPPTGYPVACAPQAWSAAAVYLLLQACLGMTINAPERQIRFTNPSMPPCLNDLRIQNLCVGDALLDLLFERHGDGVEVNTLRREGDVEVLIAK